MWLFLFNHGVAEQVRKKETAWGVMVEFKTQTGTSIFYKEEDLDKISRPLMNIKEAQEVAEIMGDESNLELTGKTWNERYRIIMDIVKGGNPIEMAQCYAFLNQVGKRKDLSFGERKMKETIHDMLKSELKVVVSNTKKSNVSSLNIARAIKGY